jgi:acetyl-CoA carboxylase carboxyl transferase subunit beta
MPATERIEQLLDPGTFVEWCANLHSSDPLQFNDGRSYTELIRAEQKKTGLQEAVVVGQGVLKGIRVVLGVLDSGFIAGSMGSVVGERITRAIEEATAQRLPLVIVASSSGARMHEGILSLMQMAKIAAAIARHDAANGFYLSVLTDPSMGGVAGFAFLGDIVLAELGAQIGFVGPRVLAQVAHIRMPDGVQTSEFALQHGFIDRIVHRRDLRNEIAQILQYVGARSHRLKCAPRIGQVHNEPGDPKRDAPA